MGTAITGTQMRTPKASVVTELPDKGVSNKIYYVPNGTTGDNKYDEYITDVNYDWPEELNRIVNIFSIKLDKIRGSVNQFNTDFNKRGLQTTNKYLCHQTSRSRNTITILIRRSFLINR